VVVFVVDEMGVWCYVVECLDEGFFVDWFFVEVDLFGY